MNCPKCKTENPDSAQICSSCGQVLTNPEPKVPIVEQKTCRSAKAALILGILSPFTCMITFPLAVICGVVALVKINNKPDRLKGNGIAIAGMCLPVALIPLMALLMCILMPTLARIRQTAYKMVCGANMSALGKAMLIYAGDYDEKIPTPSKWCDLLIEKTGITPVNFICKGDNEGPCSYAMNKYVENLGNSTSPDTVLLFDSSPGWNQAGGPELLTTKNHWGEGCNVLFVDGHVEFVKSSDLSQLRWTSNSAPPLTRGNLSPRTPYQLPEEQEIDFPNSTPTSVVEILGDVPGTDFSTWQNTGVSLRTNDVLYIKAEGQVNYVNTLTLSPDGRGNTFPPSILPDISFMSLVGKTHYGLLDDGFDSSGTGLYGPGFVGSKFKMTYRGSGDHGLTGDNVLYLAVNDSMDNDNSLAFIVKIWIVRNGRVVHNKR